MPWDRIQAEMVLIRERDHKRGRGTLVSGEESSRREERGNRGEREGEGYTEQNRGRERKK